MQAEISFGQWLKRRRKALDLTQAALARAVPCAVQTVRALEADELRPSRQLAARLDKALGLLTVGARTLPERQQTLRSTIDWSYRLLDASEQTLFARLAVFTGGWTLDAAEAICNADGVPRVDVFGVLQSLLDKSLVQEAAPVDGDGGAGHGSALGTHTPHSSTCEPRFLMLETIREYALERLEASGEAAAVRRQHATFDLALAEAASTTSWWQNQEVAQARRLGPEQGNLRAALDWASDQGAAEALLEAGGIPAPPAHRIEIDRNMAAARAQVEAAVWDAAWAEGRAMPLERAIVYALDERHRDVVAF
jgi:predicted ATPase